MRNKLEQEKVEDKIEIVKQTQAESQRILVGELRPKKNHILFEFNLEEKTIERAKFRTSGDIDFQKALKGDISSNKEVDIKEGCFYVSALNEENAWKKLAKRFQNV